ncbi:MAG: MlaD family protein [Holosporales bacterium]|jgi:phospholipid/cholesterol/gamma-HCH transport system substrate-binding protein|nr:MlaD family protein [Holosporales bacterium]
MKGNVLEAVIGSVVLVIATLFIFFAYTTSGEKINHGYQIIAKFDDASGLAVGADIKISGIKIGVIKSLVMDKNYRAKAVFLIKNDTKIPTDTVAAITTDGLMGNKFVSMTIGFNDEFLSEGDEIEDTRSSINLEELVDKFVVGMSKTGE